MMLTLSLIFNLVLVLTSAADYQNDNLMVSSPGRVNEGGLYKTLMDPSSNQNMDPSLIQNKDPSPNQTMHSSSY